MSSGRAQQPAILGHQTYADALVSPAHHGHTAKPGVPPKFDGTKSVTNWLAQMRGYLQLSGLQADRWTEFAKTYLEDAAMEQWLTSESELAFDGQNPTTWNVFATEMRVLFAPVHPVEKARLDLHKSVQGAKTAEEFAKEYKQNVAVINNYAESEQMKMSVGD